jgi:phage terminase large subunit
MGAFLDSAEGTVFTNWRVGAFEEHDKVGYGADWGFGVDPTALVKVSIDRGSKRIFIKECLYQNKLNTSQLITKFKEICGNSLIYADYGGGGDRIISDMESAKINIRKAVKGKIISGVTVLQDYEIIIDPSSFNAIKEFQNYIWDGDNPIDLYNHIIDALRYYVTNVIKQGSAIKIY